ncbi:MAG: ABC transporter ATP-binding protein [Spirochaetales bacterium]|jgi:ATP-binding cassette, subfamily B, bacterial|nr:ABC transporter ATP-binding protein [Spirochaetales bacterium]
MPITDNKSTERKPRIPLDRYTKLLGVYLKPQLLRVIFLGLLLMLSIGLQLVNPQILRYFIDAAKEGAALKDLILAAVLFIGLSVINQGVVVAMAILGNNVAWTATNGLRADVTEHCLSLKMSFHNEHTPGEMIERIDGDINALGNFFSQFALQIIGNAVLVVGIIAVTFREEPRAGLALLVFAAIALYVLNRFRSFATPYWKATRQASADFFGFLEEHLSGTEDIQACSGKNYVLRRFFGLTQAWLKLQIKSALMVNIMVNTSWLLFAVGEALALAVGAYLFKGGWITIGTVYLVFHYMSLLNRPMQAITHQMEDLQRAGASIDRVFELLANVSVISNDGTLDIDKGAASVEFRNIEFAYTDEKVLSDLSFQLIPGTILGLLGRTGAGKTTLSRLLYRLYEPQAGSIFINGIAISDFELSSLRKSIGLVTQNVHILEGTIRENLTFFDSSISNERIANAISELGLKEWINRMPDGLGMKLESGGGGLSAGEAQLLAFARILLLQNPSIVVLDEASSLIDPATERLLDASIQRLVSGKTAIIIAHRLSTVTIADEIMILDSGRIAEQGRRSNLANDPASLFSELLQSNLEMSHSEPPDAGRPS